MSNLVLQTSLLVLQAALTYVCAEVCTQVIDSCNIFTCDDDQGTQVCYYLRNIESHYATLD